MSDAPKPAKTYKERANRILSEIQEHPGIGSGELAVDASQRIGHSFLAYPAQLYGELVVTLLVDRPILQVSHRRVQMM